jgi:hypothetical protein
LVGDEELASFLESIAEDLGDRILEILREAADLTEAGGEPPPDLLARERRLSRARRSVLKAVVLLRPPDVPEE